jgi:hypothetical protein
VVPDPWAPYNRVVREYLAAGLRDDSAALRREAAASQPAVWVRDAARRQPGRLAAWTRDLSGVTGERHGDTVAVVLSADENLAGWRQLRRPGGAGEPERCAVSSSVAALLINHAVAPRVLALSSPCLDARPLQVLRGRPALLGVGAV